MPCHCHGLFSKASPTDRGFDGNGAQLHYAPHQVLTVKEIEATLDFSAIKEARLKAKVLLDIQSTLTQPPSKSGAVVSDLHRRITLNAVAFQVIQISSLDANQTIQYSYDGKVIKIIWAEGFKEKEIRRIQVDYLVDRPPGGLHFFAPTARDPDMAVHAITDHETEKARYWLPCIDYPSVRMRLKFHLLVPKGLIALANGFLAEETEVVASENGLKMEMTKSTWVLKDHLCPSYLICVAVGDFVVVEDRQVNGIALKYFAPSHFSADDLKRAFHKTPEMMEWMQSKLGETFPWPKYYQVVSPAIGGAMENISLVTWSERFLMDDRFKLERQLYTDTVNVHEMAHTYFGDLIVIRHFEHVWMKESWATYMEALWVEDHLDKQDFHYLMFQNAQAYFDEVDTKYARPLVNRKYASSWSMYDTHTYEGGCWRIHMIRSMMGDQLFWKGVQQYIQLHKNKYVETEDFRRQLENVSGMNLTQFFDEWYYKPGYPKLKAKLEHEPGSKEVKLTFTQSQMDEKKGIGLFSFQLEVLVKTKKGLSILSTADFDGLSSEQSVSAHIGDGDEVDYVELDPNNKVLFKVEMGFGEAFLKNLICGSSNIFSRIQGYRELIELGSTSAWKTFEHLFVSEPYYGVRAEVAKILFEKKSTSAITSLESLFKREQHPMALWHVVKSCMIRDPGIRKIALERLQQDKEIPYRAHGQILELLGFQANPDDLQLLLKVAQDDQQKGYLHIIRSGVYKGLGHHRSRSSFDFLLNVVERNLEHPDALASAVEGLARATVWQGERYLREQVVELLEAIVARDLDENVRKSAIRGLLVLGAKDSAELVWESRHLFAKQNWTWLENQVEKLKKSGHSGGGDGVDSLLKRVEELEARVRKLEK